MRIPVTPPPSVAPTPATHTLSLTYGARRPPNTTKLGLNFFPDADRRLDAPTPHPPTKEE